MRSNAHRSVSEDDTPVGVEIAASPDTPDRPERWTWHLRLLDAKLHPASPSGRFDWKAGESDTVPAGNDRTVVELDPDGDLGLLEVRIDPSLVKAEVNLVGPGKELLTRQEEELIALVASSGVAVLEDRHRLMSGDAMVLTGDDPLAVSVRVLQGSLAVVRIRGTTGRSVSWVP